MYTHYCPLCQPKHTWSLSPAKTLLFIVYKLLPCLLTQTYLVSVTSKTVTLHCTHITVSWMFKLYQWCMSINSVQCRRETSAQCSEVVTTFAPLNTHCTEIVTTVIAVQITEERKSRISLNQRFSLSSWSYSH